MQKAGKGGEERHRQDANTGTTNYANWTELIKSLPEEKEGGQAAVLVTCGGRIRLWKHECLIHSSEQYTFTARCTFMSTVQY